VGLAAIKALAEILQKPIAAISLLEAVARAAERDGEVLAALDAVRGDVYCGEYEIRDSRATVISEQLWTEAEFVVGAADRLVVTPDARIADLARQKGFQVSLIAAPRADVIARLGFEKIHAGEVVSAEALDATYIRRSGAEFKKSQVQG
jgi:tRNA A37 threonylcarbamoyladenosine modification protein TsaB